MSQSLLERKCSGRGKERPRRGIGESAESSGSPPHLALGNPFRIFKYSCNHAQGLGHDRGFFRSSAVSCYVCNVSCLRTSRQHRGVECDCSSCCSLGRGCRANCDEFVWSGSVSTERMVAAIERGLCALTPGPRRRFPGFVVRVWWPRLTSPSE